jgi:hypothetical protein
MTKACCFNKLCAINWRRGWDCSACAELCQNALRDFFKFRYKRRSRSIPWPCGQGSCPILKRQHPNPYELGWGVGGSVGWSLYGSFFFGFIVVLCFTGLSRACSGCRPDRLVCVKSVWNRRHSVADLPGLKSQQNRSQVGFLVA